jgi:TatD DNase family protein
MIDCHAHLADPSFGDDLDDVLARAGGAGLEAVVCVSEGLEDVPRVLALASREPLVRACLGLHPERADLEAAEQMCALIREHDEALVGVGEVGLDYWLAESEAQRELQRAILARFVTVANDLDLPLNVHSRSAGHHTLDLLREQGARRVLMHAFDGRATYAEAGVAAGFFFSVPPSIVRSPQKQKLVKRLPLAALLLETDSPVLGAEKTERNEPANVVVSARTIAALKGLPVDEVSAVTTQNARRLFSRL